MKLPAVRPVPRACVCRAGGPLAFQDGFPSGAVVPPFVYQELAGLIRLAEAWGSVFSSSQLSEVAVSPLRESRLDDGECIGPCGSVSGSSRPCSRLQSKAPVRRRKCGYFPGMRGFLRRNPSQTCLQSRPHSLIMGIGVSGGLGWRHSADGVVCPRGRAHVQEQPGALEVCQTSARGSDVHVPHAPELRDPQRQWKKKMPTSRASTHRRHRPGSKLRAPPKRKSIGDHLYPPFILARRNEVQGLVPGHWQRPSHQLPDTYEPRSACRGSGGRLSVGKLRYGHRVGRAIDGICSVLR